ncbi:MAG: SDR family oxidoreductase [Gammaproteobacteria bacterium]|nr:SDR family oxidoreductase [Gammaproteobacteria bacterium]
MRTGALVTGGGVRLGRAIALALANRGYDIVLHYRQSVDAARATAKAIEDIGVECHLVAADLGEADPFDDLMHEALRQCPRLSLLINSASAYVQRSIADTTVANFDDLFHTNLRAPFFLTRAFASQVEVGNVINILDNKIGFNQHKYAAYVLTKKALAEFTRIAAVEFAPRIRVNGVAPGVVMPAESRSDEYLQWRLNAIPLAMQGHSEHITGAIGHLVDNEFMTGQILTVDGGENIANLGRNAGDYDQSLI